MDPTHPNMHYNSIPWWENHNTNNPWYMDPHKRSSPHNQPPPAHNMSGPPQHPPHNLPMGQPMTQRPMQPGYMLPQPAHTGSAVSLNKPSQPSGLSAVPPKPMHPGGSSSPKPPSMVAMANPMEKNYGVQSPKSGTPPSTMPVVTSATLAKHPVQPLVPSGVKPAPHISQQQQQQQQQQQHQHQQQQQQQQQSYQQMIHQQQRPFQQLHQQSNSSPQPSGLPNQQQNLQQNTTGQQHIQNQQPKNLGQNAGGTLKVDNLKGPTPPVPDLISITKQPPTSQALPATNTVKPSEMKSTPTSTAHMNVTAKQAPLQIPDQAKHVQQTPSAVAPAQSSVSPKPLQTPTQSSMATKTQPVLPMQSTQQARPPPNLSGSNVSPFKPSLGGVQIPSTQMKPHQPPASICIQPKPSLPAQLQAKAAPPASSLQPKPTPPVSLQPKSNPSAPLQPRPNQPVPLQQPATHKAQQPTTQPVLPTNKLSQPLPSSKPAENVVPIVDAVRPQSFATNITAQSNPSKEVETKNLPSLTVTPTKPVVCSPKIDKETTDSKNTLTIIPKILAKIDSPEKSAEIVKSSAEAGPKPSTINSGSNLNGIPISSLSPKPPQPQLQNKSDLSNVERVLPTPSPIKTMSASQPVMPLSTTKPFHPPLSKPVSAVSPPKMSVNQPMTPIFGAKAQPVLAPVTSPMKQATLSNNFVPNQASSNKGVYTSPSAPQKAGLTSPRLIAPAPPMVPASQAQPLSVSGSPLKPVTNVTPTKSAPPQQRISPPVKEQLTPTKTTPEKAQLLPKHVNVDNEPVKEDPSSPPKKQMQNRTGRRRPVDKEAPIVESSGKEPPLNEKATPMEEKVLTPGPNYKEDSEEDDVPVKKRAARTKRVLSETPSEGERRSKRSRNPATVYQSPVSEPLARIPKSLMATPKSPRENLVYFFKNEHVALRNAEGTFYICQLAHNVYKSTRKIKIRWLSPTEDDEKCDTYKADYYDLTDFECILTSVVLEKVNRNILRLPEKEKDRIENILQRAMDRDQGLLNEKDDMKEDHPLGLDLSLYNDESQLKKRKPKRRSKGSKTMESESSGESAGESEEELQNELAKESEKEEEEEEVEDDDEEIEEEAVEEDEQVDAEEEIEAEEDEEEPEEPPVKAAPARRGKRSTRAVESKASPKPSTTATSTRRGTRSAPAPRGRGKRRAVSPPPATTTPKAPKKETQPKAALPAPTKTPRTSRGVPAKAPPTPAAKTTRRTRK